jgi:hypothetical protein
MNRERYCDRILSRVFRASFLKRVFTGGGALTPNRKEMFK